jgi:predicted GH43/DUF377 family glycosyl hydrolase
MTMVLNKPEKQHYHTLLKALVANEDYLRCFENANKSIEKTKKYIENANKNIGKTKSILRTQENILYYYQSSLQTRPRVGLFFYLMY